MQRGRDDAGRRLAEPGQRRRAARGVPQGSQPWSATSATVWTAWSTVNVDKEAQYRTQMNVLSRPAAEGIELIGHHEILLPLLHCRLRAQRCDESGSGAADARFR